MIVEQLRRTAGVGGFPLYQGVWSGLGYCIPTVILRPRGWRLNLLPVARRSKKDTSSILLAKEKVADQDRFRIFMQNEGKLQRAYLSS